MYQNVLLQFTRCFWKLEFAKVSIRHYVFRLNLLNYVRQLPFLGVYVTMFFEVFVTFSQFGIIFSIFIIAFGLGKICSPALNLPKRFTFVYKIFLTIFWNFSGFHILLLNQTPFQKFSDTILKTSVMMIGEMDFENIFFGEPDQELNFPNVRTLNF